MEKKIKFMKPEKLFNFLSSFSCFPVSKSPELLAMSPEKLTKSMTISNPLQCTLLLLLTSPLQTS